MGKIMVYYNKEHDTLDVWFGNPKDEYMCEEAGEGFILKKNKKGKVIGMEKLFVKKSLHLKKSAPVEVVVA